MALKDEWKETGKDIGHAFNSLGKTLIRSASKGVEAAEKWANEEEGSHNEESKTPEDDHTGDGK